MTMTNYITFINPPEGTHKKPQPCMPPKTNRFTIPRAVVQELDYIQRPRIHYSHLARVLEAKAKLINEIIF